MAEAFAQRVAPESTTSVLLAEVEMTRTDIGWEYWEVISQLRLGSTKRLNDVPIWYPIDQDLPFEKRVEGPVERFEQLSLCWQLFWAPMRHGDQISGGRDD